MRPTKELPQNRFCPKCGVKNILTKEHLWFDDKTGKSVYSLRATCPTQVNKGFFTMDTRHTINKWAGGAGKLQALTMTTAQHDLSQVSKRNETVVYERSRGKYLAVLW